MMTCDPSQQSLKLEPFYQHSGGHWGILPADALPPFPEFMSSGLTEQGHSLAAVYIDSYFKVDIWMVPGWGDGNQQVGKPSF